MHERLAGPAGWVGIAGLSALIVLSLLASVTLRLGRLRDTAGQPEQDGIGRAIGVTYPPASHGNPTPVPLVHVEFDGRDYMAPAAENLGRIRPGGTPVRLEYVRGKSGEVYVNRVLGPQ